MKKNRQIGLFAVCMGTIFYSFVSSAAVSDTSRVLPGIYEITGQSKHSLVLDIRTCTEKDTDNHSLQLYSPLDVNQQKFYLESLTGSYFRITTPATGEALTAGTPDSEAGAETYSAVSMQPLLYPDSLDADVTQIWRLKDAGDGYYYIYSLTGKYLTVDTSSAWEGAPVALKDFDGGSLQKWKLRNTNFSTEDRADTDLVDPYAPAGEYGSLRIILDFGDRREVLHASDFSGWMHETEEHQLILEEDALISYTERLAEKYNTAGMPVAFTASSGKELMVPPGTLGWKLDVEHTAASILQASCSSGLTTLEPVWESRGSGSPGENEVGDSYVEVSLADQKVWLYKDGALLLDTDCVTGTYQTDRQTPEGVYSIYYRQSPAVLNGPGYSSPVEYWMAFYHGYGLHDANWRNSFGGDIYLTNGSHGCVNLPTEAARQIYEVAENGFPVVCYNR